MTFNTDDELTRNLNDRIKELETMTNQIDAESTETTDITDETQEPRTEGETIFFSADVAMDQPLKLNIINNNGDVDVTGSDIDHIEIAATRKSGEDVDHAHWFFNQVANEVTLRPNWQVGNHVSDLAAKLKAQMRGGFKSSEWSKKDFTFGLDVNYDIVVKMPKNLVAGSRVTIKTANGEGELTDVLADVDFKTANGDLEVANVHGNLTINSANGDLKGHSITGNVNATTASGDIDLGSIKGSIEANTANGDVTMDDTEGWVAVRTANGDVRLRNSSIMGGRFATVGGDITLDGSLVNASDYTFDTVAGDIKLNVHVPMAGAAFKAKTVTGDIAATGDWVSDSSRQWHIGDGHGPSLNTKSVNGDIHVHAIVDESLELLDEKPGATETEEIHNQSPKRDGEINLNLDLEMERAKTWLKDLGSKLNTMVGDIDLGRSGATVEEPSVTEDVSARRTRLLEAVKNGEMTVDEALAQLDNNDQ